MSHLDGLSATFLGSAPVTVCTVEHPDAAGVAVMLNMENPTTGDGLAGLMDADAARHLAAALIVAAELAEGGVPDVLTGRL